MPSRPVNLKTRRNGKRWFLGIARTEYGPADYPIFATDPAPAGRIIIASLEKAGIKWTHVRVWAATDPSLNWEERQ